MLTLILALLVSGCAPDDGDKQPIVPGIDLDGDGWVAADDCDDNDPLVNPAASEECDGVDNDCDGGTDDAGVGVAAWYADTDGDGYGDLNAGVLACDQPTGTVADSTDCDDTNAARFPGNQEVCDELDNDCDDSVDDGATDVILSFLDEDGDGYGNSDEPSVGCTVPEGYAAVGGDCDDDDPSLYPWAASDVCGDGIDQDCYQGDAVCEE